LSPRPPIALAGGGVRIADVVRVARDGTRVSLEEPALARLAQARAVVDTLAAGDTPIYGLNSALGANTGKAIPEPDRAAYQLRAIRARAVGVGPRHPTDVVRAAMFARVAGMACGGSGVSPDVPKMLVRMLNACLHPVVPSRGSIGVADLAPLSHIALVLVGEGEAEFAGRALPGAQALALAGLAPIALGAKDGLALISANAVTVGHAALVLHDCARALDALNVGAALSFEAFRANLSPLDPRVQSARPARGQREVAQRLTALLDGSGLWSTGAARRVQDPLTFRSVAFRKCPGPRSPPLRRRGTTSRSSSTARPTVRSSWPQRGRCCPTATSTFQASRWHSTRLPWRCRIARRCASLAASASIHRRFPASRCSSPRAAPSTRDSRPFKRR
jgi:histidine ammonia-lyase